MVIKCYMYIRQSLCNCTWGAESNGPRRPFTTKLNAMFHVFRGPGCVKNLWPTGSPDSLQLRCHIFFLWCYLRERSTRTSLEPSTTSKKAFTTRLQPFLLLTCYNACTSIWSTASRRPTFSAPCVTGCSSVTTEVYTYNILSPLACK